MANENLSPMEQAHKEIPHKWYEITNPRTYLLRYAGAVVAMQAIWQYMPDEPRVVSVATAAAIFVVGAIADRRSTMRGLDASQQCEDAGLGATLGELNPLVGKVKNSEEYRRSRGAIAMEVFQSVIPVLNPSIGAAMGVNRFMASLSNNRAANRATRAAEIARQEISS